MDFDWVFESFDDRVNDLSILIKLGNTMHCDLKEM